MNSGIVVQHVHKHFPSGLWKKKMAIDDLSFSVEQGHVTGLLGPNGSGKSTTIKLLLGFLKPTSGTLSIFGHTAGSREARRAIGYLPENPKFQKFLSAEQALYYFSDLLNISRTEREVRCGRLLELVGLLHARRDRIQGFSKGMVQRLAIAQALLHHPKLLIFDEPMSGLDPVGRREIRELIQDVHRAFPTTTIFFSTHILSDVEQLCASVLVLRNGKLHLNERVSTLLSTQPIAYEIVTCRGDKREHIAIPSTEELLSCLESLRKQSIEVFSVHSSQPNLERSLFGRS